MWLSAKEKAEREQEALLKEAAEKKADDDARKVTISFDFAGRRVLAGPDSASPAGLGGDGGFGGGAALAAEAAGVGPSAYGGQGSSVLGGCAFARLISAFVLSQRTVLSSACALLVLSESASPPAVITAGRSKIPSSPVRARPTR